MIKKQLVDIECRSLKTMIDLKKTPRHIAIIMDGNGRWAKKRGEIRIIGHKNGALSVKSVVEAATEVGIKFLTLYAFSTENWKRPKDEIQALMSILQSYIQSELASLIAHNIRILTIGNTNSLPVSVRETFNYAIKTTSNNTGLTLILALSYSAKYDIVHSIQLITKDIKDEKLKISDISEDILSTYLSTANIPDPELLIRTSGEYRISNFLLWETAYTELYFTETLWPDFDKEELFKAILDYQNREKQYGITSEKQTKKNTSI